MRRQWFEFWEAWAPALAIVVFVIVGAVAMAAGRYQVGEPVSLGVYTETFDVNDPAYKFMQIIYGDPNSQTLQAAPDDWVQQFGNSERTLLLHAVSELRVVVASQGRAIMDLEARIDEMELRHEESDPNGGGE